RERCPDRAQRRDRGPRTAEVAARGTGGLGETEPAEPLPAVTGESGVIRRVAVAVVLGGRRQGA
ncbi:MAG: hypothetical protein WAL35_04865, partial [Acidimicrobiales bacterium]